MTLCKLCIRPLQETGPIRRSHIIPKFFLKKSKSREGRFVRFDRSKNQVDLTQGDLAEDMLCDECEQGIKIRYEDFLNEVLFLRRKTTVLENGKHHTSLGGSTDRLALAAMSIFWRAAVAKDLTFDSVVLPNYVQEALREWVLSRSLPHNWSQLVTVGIQSLVNVEGKKMPFFMTPFVREHPSQFEFVFVCGGFMFSFFVPPRPDQVYARTTAIKPRSQIIRIKSVDFMAVEEIREICETMMDSPKSAALVNGIDLFLGSNRSQQQNKPPTRPTQPAPP